MDRAKKEWMEIWSINEVGGSKIGVLWDTMKEIMRGIDINHVE